MKIDLHNKVVLVTGGSSGIGEAISNCLAKSGATVALHYNNSKDDAEKFVKQFGNKSECFQANLRNPQNAVSLFNKVLKHFSKFDVLVNNAGIFVRSPIQLDNSKWLDDWNTTVAINLTSAGVLSQCAIKYFMENSGGTIIHIASRAAFRGETEDYLAYAASKGGLVSLSRSIARSFGKYNIKSFVIAPGFVRTRMTEKFLNTFEKDIIENELSLNELTTPEDIAKVVTFIASGMMDHATGSTIDINAGSYMR